MRLLPLVAIAPSLAACFSGSGGASVNSSNPTPKPVLTFLLPPGTYAASSAAMTFNSVSGTTSSAIADANGGSSLTVNGDGAGHPTSVTFNISTGGITRTMTLVPDGTVQPVGPNQTAFATAAGGAFSLFGAWASSEDNAGNFKFGGFAAGEPTTPQFMPTAGSAVYNGTMVGLATNGTNEFAVAGSAQISANFGSRSVGTNFFNITQQQVGTNVQSAVAGFSGTAQLSGNIYAGPLASANGLQTGDVRGQFYGPHAQETAGVWRITGAGTTAVGGFGAR